MFGRTAGWEGGRLWVLQSAETLVTSVHPISHGCCPGSVGDEDGKLFDVPEEAFPWSCHCYPATKSLIALGYHLELLMFLFLSSSLTQPLLFIPQLLLNNSSSFSRTSSQMSFACLQAIPGSGCTRCCLLSCPGAL